MPKSSSHKSKLLYVMKILLENTDEQNAMSTSDIISALKSQGIDAERKSIYADIEALRLFGIDIETKRDRTTGYYIAGREFELPELKLLVDAVQSSVFITEKKSRELIDKLSSLTSKPQAQNLKRRTIIGQPKSANEHTFYSIDAINTATIEGKMIEFKYFDYDVNKQRVFRKNGAAYKVTPITLHWDSDKYYLVAYSAEHGGLRNYRVDRMINAKVSETDADNMDNKNLDVSEHIKRAFGMFIGEPVRAVLAFDNSLVNVVLDYFGGDTDIEPKDNGQFEIKADVSVSPVFLGWMFQFGGRAVIKSPESLINSMRQLIAANTLLYRPLSENADNEN